MTRLWAAIVTVAFVAEASAMIVILGGGRDRTLSAWVRSNIPPWLVAAVCGWAVVHTLGEHQDTRAAVLTTIAAILAAWATMKMIGGLR